MVSTVYLVTTLTGYWTWDSVLQLTDIGKSFLFQLRRLL